MIWLASYPRSGNTFLRNIMYELYGLESCDYHQEKGYKVEKDYALYPLVKTHLLPWQLVPADKNIPAVYLIRDGRDALVSMAHQRKDLIAPDSDFNDNLRMAIMAQKGSYFGGWSENVKQWAERAQLILRYEDLVADPIAGIRRIQQLMGLPEPDFSRIPSFHDLKFGKPKYDGTDLIRLNNETVQEDYPRKFFRKGKAGGWREDMNEEMHDLFWSYHGEMMERMGYSYEGTPTPMHGDLDRAILKKMGMPLRVETRKKKVLVEASKLLLWFNEGTKRYIMELLKGMLQVAEAEKSNWEIDLYIGGTIYSLQECHNFLNRDDVMQEFLTEKATRKQSGKVQTPQQKSFVRKQTLRERLNHLANGVVRHWKKTFMYQAFFHASYYVRKYPLRFKVNSIANKVLRRLRLKPWITDLSQYDLIHLPLMQNYHQFLNIQGNYVVTIHDLTHLYFPHFHRIENIECCELAMDFVQKKGAEIIAISNSTRHDYLQETNTPVEKVHVIYEAADRKKFRMEHDKKLIGKIKDSYKIPDAPYILCLSTIEPRKNLVNTVKAFCKFIEEHPDATVNLVIAGKKGWKHEELFDMDIHSNKRIIFTGFVAEEDLPCLYSGALGLSYVSYYEGFGLPPLEAMCCSTPVIYGNNSSMIEVVGDAGYKADANSIDSIKRQMEILYYDKRLREEKSRQSLKQSFKFSWRSTILETLNVYEKVIARTKSNGIKVETTEELSIVS